MLVTNVPLVTLLALLSSANAQFLCVEAILSTVSYEPALLQHTSATGAGSGACPTSYSAVESSGCCPNTATLQAVNNGIGCCRCGAGCTGSVAAPLVWAEVNGQLVLTMTSPSTVVMTVPSRHAVATPVPGPLTSSDATDTGSSFSRVHTAPGPVSLSNGSPAPFTSAPGVTASSASASTVPGSASTASNSGTSGTGTSSIASPAGKSTAGPTGSSASGSAAGSQGSSTPVATPSASAANALSASMAALLSAALAVTHLAVFA